MRSRRSASVRVRKSFLQCRCASFVATSLSLRPARRSGFTLTNGATLTVTYPTTRESSGGGLWCESASEVASNCLVVGNSALYGGGAYQGTLNNCMLIGNWAHYGGGGTYNCTLNNCGVTGNSAQAPFIIDGTGDGPFGGGAYGGGAYRCTLNHCTLTGNVAQTSDSVEIQRYDAYNGRYSAGAHGGGVSECTLKGCVLANNGAEWYCYSLFGSAFCVESDGGGA